MKNRYFLLAFFASVALAFSCTSTNLDEIAPPPTGGPCDSTYVFNGKISKIIEQNCSGIQHASGCHSGGSLNGDFTSYAGIKDKVDGGSFGFRVLQSKDMPPNYSPGPKAMSMLDLTNPALNWVQMAEGMGVPAWRVTTVEEFSEALKRSLASPGPSLIEAML